MASSVLGSAVQVGTNTNDSGNAYHGDDVQKNFLTVTSDGTVLAPIYHSTDNKFYIYYWDGSAWNQCSTAVNSTAFSTPYSTPTLAWDPTNDIGWFTVVDGTTNNGDTSAFTFNGSDITVLAEQTVLGGGNPAMIAGWGIAGDGSGVPTMATGDSLFLCHTYLNTTSLYMLWFYDSSAGTITLRQNGTFPSAGTTYFKGSGRLATTNAGDRHLDFGTVGGATTSTNPGYIIVDTTGATTTAELYLASSTFYWNQGAASSYRLESSGTRPESATAWWDTQANAFYFNGSSFVWKTRVDWVQDAATWTTQTSPGKPSIMTVADLITVGAEYSPVDDSVHVVWWEDTLLANGASLRYARWDVSGASWNDEATVASNFTIQTSSTGNPPPYRLGMLFGLKPDNSQHYVGAYWNEFDGSVYDYYTHAIVDTLGVGGAFVGWGIPMGIA